MQYENQWKENKSHYVYERWEEDWSVAWSQQNLQVLKFKYLGSFVNLNGRCTMDIDNWLTYTMEIFKLLKKAFRKKFHFECVYLVYAADLDFEKIR